MRRLRTALQAARRHWALTIVVAGSLTAGGTLLRYGRAFLFWDESEYLSQVFDTVDYVKAHGVLAWVWYIGHGQGAAKPPLYVNTLAALALVMGRDHAVAGAWVMASAMAALLAFLTYRLFEPVVGEGFAVVAAMGVTAMPAVANWDALAYPDTQMTAIALAVIVLLANGGGRWGWRRSAWLGVLLGLGMLAKLTFAAVAGPAMLWWLWRGDGKSAFVERLRACAVAAVTGAATASVWYGSNWRSALSYAQFARDAALDPAATRMRHVMGWLSAYSRDGVGFPMLVVCLAAIALGWARAERRIALLLAGALPLLVYLATGDWPNSRHPLPALVLLALALLLAAAKGRRWKRAIFVSVAVVVGAQWLAVRAVDTTLVTWRPRTELGAKAVDYFVPALWRRPASDAAVDAAEGWVARAALPVWYVSGNDSDFNAYRLGLAVRAARVPVRIEWGCSYNWPPQQCLNALGAIAGKGGGLVVYERLGARDELSVTLAGNDGLVEKYVADPGTWAGAGGARGRRGVQTAVLCDAVNLC